MNYLKKLSFLSFVMLLLMSFKTQAQQEVSGTITEAGTSTPIVGATILIKNTNNGTTSDFDGKFTINAQQGDVIVISYIGYLKQEISVTGDGEINVALKIDNQQLDEVILTGVFDQRTRMESSIAISVLKPEVLSEMAPISAADLLKNVPGVYVNSSLGEIRNTVYSRGVSVGSNDGASGYYYVSMQEDGLPVTNATFTNYGPDYYLRADLNIGRLEAVRGGTASILGNNAPGGIFNYVSKEGGDEFKGEVQTKYGFEGNTNHLYQRVDANFGGPLTSKEDNSLFYNIGGFYRTNEGARYPGYPMNEGGQIKANIVKKLDKGSLKLYVKYLNDKNAWFEFTPTYDFNNPTLPEGVTENTSVLIPGVQSSFYANDETTLRNYDSTDKIHSKDLSIGLNFENNFSDSFKISNNARYSKKSSLWNTTAVAYPFAVDNFLFYAITGDLGHFGTYDFNDLNGNNLISVNQNYDPNNPYFPFAFEATNNGLPGTSIQPNSILFNPMFYVDNQVNEFIDQFSMTKKLEHMSFTAGGFYANSTFNNANGVPGAMYSQLTTPIPTPTTLTYTGMDWTTLTPFTEQRTSDKGITTANGARSPLNTNKATQNQLALFLGHSWELSEKLTFDWGVRFEKISVNGSNYIWDAGEPSATGGVDGDPSTTYDNGTAVFRDSFNFDRVMKTTSYSAGLNYAVNDNNAYYLRVSKGNKAPDLSIFLGIDDSFKESNTEALNQAITQVEFGYKYQKGGTNLFITPFYSVLDNVASLQTGTEDGSFDTSYQTPVLYNKFTTKGIELEGLFELTDHFSVRAVATFQNSMATRFQVYNLGANGKDDDTIVDYSGNKTDNSANTILKIAPSFRKGKFSSTIDWSYLGERAANVANVFSLPAFNQTNAVFGYKLNEKISLQANINNLFNVYGVMGWSAPGGFPASLDRQGFTKATMDANPNAVYSTLALPARAYFVTLNYKF